MKNIINKNKIVQFIIITCVFFIIFFILHQNIVYSSYHYEQKNIDKVLTSEDVIYIDGYTKNGNKFTLCQENAYFKIKSPIKAGSVKINLKDIESKKADIKIYYSSNDSMYDEAKTLTTSVNSTNKSATFNIPSSIQNEYFLIKVGGNFSLDNIEISSQNAVLEKIGTNTSNHIIFGLIDLIISFCISLIIVLKNLIGKLFVKISSIKKEEIKKYLFRIGIYTLSVVLILSVQVFFTKQFVAFIDGHYVINTMRLSFSIMLVTLFWGFIWLRGSFKRNIEKIFLLVSLSVGITYAIATPMLQETTWDGGIHYGNTIELVYADQDKLPALDKNVGWLEISYNLNDMNSIKEKYNTNYYYINGTVETKDWSLVGIYNSLGYLPHSFGIFLARGLGLTFTASILLGKIFSSICFSSIVYLAMKRLNTGKLVMFILALYPTVIMLAGTYSYDAWVNAWMFLGVAYLLANIQEKDKFISLKELLIIPISMFIAIGPKAIYFPIMLMCYFMPKTKFSSDKYRYIYYSLTTGLMFLAIISFLVPFIFGVSSGTEVGDTRGGADVNSSLQVRNIISHPIEYTKTLLLFLKDYWSFGNIADYSTNLAYIGKGQYSIVLIGGMLATLFIGEKNRLDKNINNLFKVFTILLVFGISAMVASAFYVAYTSVGANFIAGCQPRYLLPLLFPIAYCLRNTFKPLQIRQEMINFIICSISTFIAVYILFANMIMIYSIY